MISYVMRGWSFLRFIGYIYLTNLLLNSCARHGKFNILSKLHPHTRPFKRHRKKEILRVGYCSGPAEEEEEVVMLFQMGNTRWVGTGTPAAMYRYIRVCCSNSCNCGMAKSALTPATASAYGNAAATVTVTAQ